MTHTISGHRKDAAFIMLMVIVLIIGGVGTSAAREPVEEQRISRLISIVESLPKAQFIRNGVIYDGKAAAEHLRMKLRLAGGRVKTADDFIRLCASRSSLSGDPYRIRFADGTVRDTEEFLKERLQVMVIP